LTKLKNINQVLIDLKVGENQVLFLLFSDDGMINRKGDGHPDCTDNLLVIGKSKDDVFGKIKPYIKQEMENFLGSSFTANDMKGRKCTLSMMLKSKEIESSVQFIYGELSEGPPEPFRLFLTKAIEVTERWFQEEKKSIIRNRSKYKFETETAPEKPWWKVWF
jgi:hypothetical protein